MVSHHDLVIVGAGSGNTILDERFESWDVAIVEEAKFGGTCLNHGCIPTKMLVSPADLVESIRHADRLGVDADPPSARWRDIRDRVFGRIDPIVDGGAHYRRSQPHVTVITGTGVFVGARRMEIVDGIDAGAQVTADRWVIAAGARPTIPEIPGLDTVAYETSDTVMRIDELPQRLLILGGGFIATELAHVYDAFGVDVELITRGPRLLSHHDHEIADAFTAIARDRWNVHLSCAVATAGGSGGEVTLEVEEPDGSIRPMSGDLLLIATGRSPNSDRLQVTETGVRVDESGFIETDSTLQAADGVWALGDIRTPLMLKHVANHEARVIQHNLLSPHDPIEADERAVPHAVFTSPQIASVGATTEELLAADRPFVSATRSFGDTAFGWALEDTTSMCKIVADPTSGDILGAHIMGPQAATLIQQLVQAMRFDLNVERLARDQMYVHPALTEVIEQTLLELVD